ncbi:hypothetical protein ACF09K_17060 [Streptomyces sp. NPDC014882]|uniref:hypothetical protein n=1 Tax=Streptomyces sp. NPDC014882 TaxID=3364927 RepID=UPI0036F4C71E
MGTALAPQRRERLGLLLAASTGVTFTIAAVADALAVRRARRRAAAPSAPPARHQERRAGGRPAGGRTDRRTPAPVTC